MAFDPALKAKVQVLPQKPDEFLDERFIRHLIKEKRGVAVFVPTRAEVERLAAELGEQWPRLTTAFYHGGEPIRVIRPFLEGEVERPFLLAMTAAGQSALNVRGLDTVVIYDARYGNVVERGRNVLTGSISAPTRSSRWPDGCTAGCRTARSYILSDRDLVFEELRAHAARVPARRRRRAGGDHLRRARAWTRGDLDLPVPLDRTAYRRALRAAHRAAGWSRTAGSPPTGARSRRCRWSGPGASSWCTPTPSWCRSWPCAPTSTRCTA